MQYIHNETGRWVITKKAVDAQIQYLPASQEREPGFKCIRFGSITRLNNMQIEFATQADLPALADLLAELFSLEADFRPDRAKQLAGLQLILDNPASGQLFVLRLDGAVAGMANALITFSTAEGGRVLLLEDVIVSRNCRGNGAGRRLVEHVLAWAQSQGMSRVTLLADKDNAPALGFYEKMGFQVSAMKVLRRNLGQK